MGRLFLVDFSLLERRVRSGIDKAKRGFEMLTTVADLIAELQKYPADLPVMTNGFDESGPERVRVELCDAYVTRRMVTDTTESLEYDLALIVDGEEIFLDRNKGKEKVNVVWIDYDGVFTRRVEPRDATDL